MTATPHSGKEADFQLFMALLDGDRFEGRFREGVHTADVSDMLRRLTKEELKTFDGRPLFPERRAYTVNYQLSADEAELYDAVTDYVREEMNRAERLAEGDQRRQNVGFALQILQRRLASSPAAIHESLRRRREKLERRLEEERLLQRGRNARLAAASELASYRPEFFEDFDDQPEDEVEEVEEQLVDSATAAQTIAELELEIAALNHLEEQAKALRRSGTDTKWRELQSILDEPLMTDAAGNRRKLIIFTEPRDTLDLPRRQDPHPARPRRGRGRDPRRHRPRGAPHRHQRLPARPGGAGHGRQRRRRRGRQPPARPPDGQLRPALEPQPPRAALRPHPPHRPDRGLPPLEPGRQRDPRGRRLRPPAGEARGRPRRRSAAGSTTCSASCSSRSPCAIS